MGWLVNKINITPGGVGSPIGRRSGSLTLRKSVFHCGRMGILMSFISYLMCFNDGSIFVWPVEVEVVFGPSQHVFLVCFFPIGITRWTFRDISKIIGKGYNVLCFHVYFDLMLLFIGNSQCFCISSKCPSAVSQLFFLFQPSHGASLKTNVGWRQLFIASCRKRASAFTTLSKPGFLLT